MAYLDKNDYTLRIAVSHLDEILEQAVETTGLTADNARSNAESWAMAFVKSYVGAKYNIAAEFSIAAPATRNFLVMQWIIDLSLCTLHKTINPRDVPEHISQACTDVVAMLEKVRSGEMPVDLPGYPVNPGDPAGFQHTFLGSQEKFISKPYQDARITGSNQYQNGSINPYSIDV